MKNRSVFSIGYRLFWAIVLLLIGCVFALFATVSVASLLEMRQWTVVDAHLKKVWSSSTGLEISAEYEYVFAGQTYTGHQVDCDAVHSRAEQQQRLKYLRQALYEKRPVPCYVDSRTPAEAVLFRGADWSGLLMTCSFSLVFAGLGIRICVFEWLEWQKDRDRDRLERLHINQPWMWKADWSRGVIRSGSKGKMIRLWGIAAFCCGIFLPWTLELLHGWHGSNSVIQVCFLLVATGLLIAALRATLISLKHGRAEFVLHSGSGVIGGELVGAIRIPYPVVFEDRVGLTLKCIRKYRRGRGGTSESVLWHAGHDLDRKDIEVTQETLLPVAFSIPRSCRETEEEQGIEWRVEASGRTPGLNFQAQFEVPVYYTADSPTVPIRPKPIDTADALEFPQTEDRRSFVHVRRLEDGTVELEVPPLASYLARDFEALTLFLSLLVFAVFWTVVCSFLTKANGPWILTVVFWFVDVLLWWNVLQTLSGKKCARVTEERIDVASRFLCFWTRNTIQAEDVRRIDVAPVSETEGDRVQANPFLRYRVRVFYDEEGKERHADIASRIASRSEAERIAEAVRECLLGE